MPDGIALLALDAMGIPLKTVDASTLKSLGKPTSIASDGTNTWLLNDGKGGIVKVVGKLEGSSNTSGHYEQMEQTAIKMAATGRYSEIYFQKAWKTVSSGQSSSGDMPDVLGVRRANGKIDAVEVLSKTDDPHDVRTRVNNGLKTLPLPLRGSAKVMPPLRLSSS